MFYSYYSKIDYLGDCAALRWPGPAWACLGLPGQLGRLGVGRSSACSSQCRPPPRLSTQQPLLPSSSRCAWVALSDDTLWMLHDNCWSGKVFVFESLLLLDPWPVDMSDSMSQWCRRYPVACLSLEESLGVPWAVTSTLLGVAVLCDSARGCISGRKVQVDPFDSLDPRKHTRKFCSPHLILMVFHLGSKIMGRKRKVQKGNKWENSGLVTRPCAFAFILLSRFALFCFYCLFCFFFFTRQKATRCNN